MTDMKKTPILVWAPTARCGITLMQRLLCSSEQALVYGENKFFLQVLPDFLRHLSQYGQQHSEALERILRGEFNFWASAAWPSCNQISKRVIHTFLDVAAIHAEEAQRHGYQYWGMKLPEVDWQDWQVICSFFPDAYHIFMLRDIAPVLRSYLSRKWLKNQYDLDRISGTWLKGVGAVEKLHANEAIKVLPVFYERLIEHSENELMRIESFLGISGIDRNVMNHKVNTFVGQESDGHAANSHVEPTVLSEREERVVESVRAEIDYASLMARLCTP